MLTVDEVMTRNPKTAPLTATVQQAAQLMDELNVGSLPVCIDGKVVGIITDRDITVRATAAGLDPTTILVDAVMSEGVRCCHLQQSVKEVMWLMASVQIRRLPVLDVQRKIIGIVSLGDIAARTGQILGASGDVGADGAQDALRRISTPLGPDLSKLAA